MAEPVEQCDNVPGQVRLDAIISAFLIPYYESCVTVVGVKCKK